MANLLHLLKHKFPAGFTLLLFLAMLPFGSYSQQRFLSTVKMNRDTLNLQKPVRNSVYIELAGNAGYYSLNYERLFPLRKKIAFSTRIGYSLSGARPRGALLRKGTSQLIPVEASFLLGKKNKLEIGIGYTPLIRTYRGDFYDLNNYTGIRLGYRYQPEESDLYFKTGILLARNLDPYISTTFINIGVAFGLSF